MDDEDRDICIETAYKVFVSRIPTKWTRQLLLEHFQSLFGEAADAEIFTSRKKKDEKGICYSWKNSSVCDKGISCPYSHSNTESSQIEESLGSGSVYFHTEEAMNNALDQKSLHLSKRIIKISKFAEKESRDTTTCFAWQRFNCTRGDDCKFEHEGQGACEKVGVAYQGRKFQCLSFKSKGKCSKGSACLFLHVVKEKKTIESKLEVRKTLDVDGVNQITKGICNTFKKKLKCRKGDNCPYSHDILPKASLIDSTAEKKRKRVNGKVLVERRTKLKDEDGVEES